MLYVAAFTGLGFVCGLIANYVLWRKRILPLWMVSAATGVLFVVLSLVYFVGLHVGMEDTEILNGQVTGKFSERVSCEHSYACHCVRDSKGNQTCQTCYEHSYDVDWTVQSSVGNFDIDRVNRQGTKEPPRWTIVEKGQPVARRHPFKNYLKANPDSLFTRRKNTAFEIPAYPSKVYDYHYLDRVITSGVAVPDLKAWNHDLAMMLRAMGPSKQVNVIVVLTAHADPEFALDLRDHWLGGKQNDVIVVANWPDLKFVNVFGWAADDIMNVTLRQHLLETQPTREAFLKTIEGDVTAMFQRRPMEQYKYLSESAEPGWIMLTFMFLLATAGMIVPILFLKENK